MKPVFPLALPGALLITTVLTACGGDSDGPARSDVAMRFSDAPVDTASKVVVTVDSITFVGADETTVVETFTSTELGIEEVDTFTIDLLEVQGEESRLVLDRVNLKVGSYSDLRLGIIDEDVNYSYVEEVDSDVPKQLKVPSGELKLGAFEVTPQSTQTFVIEFGLRQSMTYNPGPDRYILKPRGVRIVALEQAATVAGTVDIAALNDHPDCNANPDVLAGNPVYLYAGKDYGANVLGDDFDVDLAVDADTDLVAPYVSGMLDDSGSFTFAFLEPGDYTVAVTCDPGDDDEIEVDNLRVPLPATAFVEATVQRGQRADCVIGGTLQGCTVTTPEVDVEIETEIETEVETEVEPPPGI